MQYSAIFTIFAAAASASPLLPGLIPSTPALPVEPAVPAVPVVPAAPSAPVVAPVVPVVPVDADADDESTEVAAGNDGNVCPTDNVVSCCTTDDPSLDILGGSCLVSNIVVGLVPVPVGDNFCDSGSAYCCQTNSTGLINVDLSCIPILS